MNTLEIKHFPSHRMGSRAGIEHTEAKKKKGMTGKGWRGLMGWMVLQEYISTKCLSKNPSLQMPDNQNISKHVRWKTVQVQTCNISTKCT